jgi:hypothetical protein
VELPYSKFLSVADEHCSIRSFDCTLERFEDWRQCAAVMQKEAVTVMPRRSGGGNVVVA